MIHVAIVESAMFLDNTNGEKGCVGEELTIAPM